MRWTLIMGGLLIAIGIGSVMGGSGARELRTENAGPPPAVREGDNG